MHKHAHAHAHTSACTFNSPRGRREGDPSCPSFRKQPSFQRQAYTHDTWSDAGSISSSRPPPRVISSLPHSICNLVPGKILKYAIGPKKSLVVLMLTTLVFHAAFPRLPHFAAPAVSLQGARLTSDEQDCLTAYTSALSGAIAGAAQVVNPLRGLLHADVTIADEVWTRTLEVAWATFSDRKRAEFSGVAGSLLAKPWHTKAMNLPPLMQGSHSVSIVCWCLFLCCVAFGIVGSEMFQPGDRL